MEKTTNGNYNVDLASSLDKKFLYDLSKELYFDAKAMGKKPTGDRALIKLLKSPSIMVCAPGVSRTIFLPENPNELCDRLKLLLREKQTGNNTDIINEEIIAIVDEFLDYKCISMKQHEQFLFKCNPLHTKKNQVQTLI